MRSLRKPEWADRIFGLSENSSIDLTRQLHFVQLGTLSSSFQDDTKLRRRKASGEALTCPDTWNISESQRARNTRMAPRLSALTQEEQRPLPGKFGGYAQKPPEDGHHRIAPTLVLGAPPSHTCLAQLKLTAYMVVLLGKEQTSLVIITLRIFLAIFEKWHCARRQDISKYSSSCQEVRTLKC